VVVSAPGWPRLAARLLRPQVTTVRGRWRAHGASGTFAHRAPDEWVTLDEHGRRSDAYDVRHTLRPQFERGDYCTAAGPVTAVEHDGRPAWRVALVPPPHKRGLLLLTVDDATGLLVEQRNATGGHTVELVDLVVDEPLADEVFAAQVELDLEHAHDRARWDLAQHRPVPTPQWFPWRRCGSEGPGLVVVESDRGRGSVGRARLGQPAPAADWLAPDLVHRFEHRGESWAVGSRPPMTAVDARRVVDEVLDHAGARSLDGGRS
jgi:hypothetical protein